MTVPPSRRFGAGLAGLSAGKGSGMPLTIDYIDTCASDYLQDHCNGDRETLYGVPVDGATTLSQVVDALRSDLPWYDAIPDSVTDADVAAAIDDYAAAIAAGRPAGIWGLPAAPHAPADDESGAFVWYRLRW